MKLNPSNFLRLAIPGAAGIPLIQAAQAATVLTGSGLANNVTIPANHGSNAGGTPAIGLTWSPVGSQGWQAYTGWPNGGGAGTAGEVYQLDGPAAGYPGTVNFQIVFTPGTATVAVLLTSITLNDYSGANPAASIPNTVLNWTVTGPTSGTLGSGTGVMIADGTTQNLNFGLRGAGGEAITLTLTPTAGSGSYFAVDNLSFDQVTIPEPSGLALAAGGLGVLALRRRRK